MRLLFFNIFAIIIFLPITAAAQSFDGSFGDIGGNAFAVSVSPQYPSSYSQATVSLISGSVDLINATLSVSIGGKETYRGAVKPFSVTLGKVGSVTNVKVTISSGGTNYVQNLSIQPQDVVIIAEPISSAPPLYPGKPFAPLEGSVRVVAVANLKNASGAAINPSVLSYAWTVDDTQIANSSGIGKTTIVVASPLQYRTRDVSVIVTNADGSLVGGESLSISPQEPSVRIYENNSLLGIRFDRALSDNYTVSDTEATLFASPFSFPTTNGALSLKWFLNGKSVQTGNTITLRPTGSGQGSASLSFVASSGDYTTAAASLSLSFGEALNSNFFGL